MKGKATTCLKNFTNCLAFASFAFLVSTSNSESFRIHSANDLIDFSNDVNNGSTYSGTTVYLDSDIEFDSGLSELFTPIGSAPSYFRGTFDGQGYTISNLNITSSSQNVGLFGYSTGTTIKNLVIDESCSFTSTFSSGSIYSGSVMGQCISSNSPCTITNVVNMGKVSFSGSTNGYNFIGGIAGHLSVPTINGYPVNVINCANYGTVVNTGSADSFIEVGGIAGYCGGGSSNINCKVQNCVNLGMVSNEGEASLSYVGGIVGNLAKYGLVENCVNTGDLENEHEDGSIGEIIGSIDSTGVIEITHCLSTGSYYFYGALSSSTSGTTVTTSSTSVALSLLIVSELNDYSEDNDGFNKWVLNLDENEISFSINGGKAITLASQLILLPDPVGDSEHTFSGWFTDSSCTNKFDSESVSSSTTLYGGWGYKVALSVDDGTAVTTTKDVVYGQKYGEFQVITELKEGHTLKWFTKENGEGEEITAESIVSTARDHTLYGYYVPNKYTVTFDFCNGTTLNETVEYDKEINFPEDAEREGYTFNGWNNSGITKMPGHDITFTANWTETVQISSSSSSDRISSSSSSLTRGISHLSSPSSSPLSSSSSSSSSSKIGEKSSISSSSIQIPSEYVEIVFDKKDLSEEEIKEIINKYVDNANYEMKITKMDDGTTTVLIKFVDVETATNFVENINAGSDLNEGMVKKVGFITESVFSSSPLIFPFVHLLYVLF